MYFKEFREKIGISQKDALQKLQIQQATIVRYENATNSPSTDFLKKYCETLDANPNFLLFGTEPYLLSAAPSLNLGLAHLLQDALNLFGEKNLEEKLSKLIIDDIVSRIEKVDNLLVQALKGLMGVGYMIESRPFLFLYYIFQIISVDTKKKDFKTPENCQQYIISTIENYEVLSIKNQPVFTYKIKKEFVEFFEFRVTEEECCLLVKQANTVLNALETNMPTYLIKLHREVFHA